jgi:hypothetical protein
MATKNWGADSQMSTDTASPTTTYFRVCEGLPVRFADSKADSDVTVPMLAAVAGERVGPSSDLAARRAGRPGGRHRSPGIRTL